MVSILRFSYIPLQSGPRSIDEFLACFHQTCFHHVPYAVSFILPLAPFLHPILRLCGVRPVILLRWSMSGSPAAVADREYGWLRGDRSCFRERILPLYKLMAPLQCPALFIGIPSPTFPQESFVGIWPDQSMVYVPWEGKMASVRVCPRTSSDRPQVGARRIQERTMAIGSSQAPFALVSGRVGTGRPIESKRSHRPASAMPSVVRVEALGTT